MRHTIYFIRHGETDWNKAGRLQGQQDIPLNTLGRGQADRNGTMLRDLLPSMDLPFISSPLGRTRETMEIVRQSCGLPPNAYAIDDRLSEIAFGEFEGELMSELPTKLPAQHALRQADKYNYQPKGGESYAMLVERVRGVIEALKEDTVIVSHGGVSRAFRAIIYNLPETEVVTLPTPQDKIMIFSADQLAFV